MKLKLSIWDMLNVIIITVLGLIMLLPFINILAISLNDGYDTAIGGITIWPRVFTLDNYKMVFQDSKIYKGFSITLYRTILGTTLALLATSIFSYALSRKNLIGRKVYITLCLITMYFNGGLIPRYMLYDSLGLLNNLLVYILPNLINIFNVIIMMTYFSQLPEGMIESAKIDGAGEFKTFFSIVFPTSMPIIAVVTLYVAVFHWNHWFDAYMFITRADYRPLQNILVETINSNSAESMSDVYRTSQDSAMMRRVTNRSMLASVMMVAVGPIVLAYPFLQKYFIKGMMIGAIKG